jgi:OOP family OmpA-OmpF porin
MLVHVERAPINSVSRPISPWLLAGMIALAAAATGGFGIALYRRKKPFVIRDMMLIHNDGFLISRYASPHLGEIDEDVLSGMLTAVLNFVEDSMSSSQDQLKTFGFKEYQVLVSRGSKTFVAIVYAGDAPSDIDKPLNEFISKIEKIYKKKIAAWTGDIETDFAGTSVLLESFVKEHDKGNRKKPLAGLWTHKQRPPAPEK